MAKRGFLDVLVKAMVQGGQELAKSQKAQQGRTGKVRGEPFGYPVGIVGESNYQSAIRQCLPGETVALLREPSNPHDPRAIAVVCPRGRTIGYISRDSFVQRAVHEDGCGIDATIYAINTNSGRIGVVLDVDVLGRSDGPIGERPFKR